MTSVLLQPDSTGVDGVSLSTLRDFSKVVDAGFQWVSLYLGGDYGVKPYAIEAAWDAGLRVMLNYERTPDAAKGGYRVGEQAARTAITQARQLGFNGECPLPFSAADEHFSDIAGAGLDYHRALVDVFTAYGIEVGQPWVGGAYGFKEMLELLAQQDWWPDDWPLWHWGGDGRAIYPWTWVKQGPGGSYFDPVIGLRVDRNRLYKPMRFWSGYGADKLDPTEDDMTEAELRAIVDPQFKAIWDVLTQPVAGIPTDSGMQWNLILLRDHIVDKDHLVNRIVEAVVASLPPAQTGGLNVQQVTDACELAVKTVLEQTTYLSVPQFP